MEITINTERFFSAFLEMYNSLEEKDDHLWSKQEKAESEGNAAKAQKLERHMDKINAKMDGMHEVLYMLGYTVKWQEDKFVIVRR